MPTGQGLIGDGCFRPAFSARKWGTYFKGNTINFLPDDGDLIAEALDRGILSQDVNKRTAHIKRFNRLLDNMLEIETDR